MDIATYQEKMKTKTLYQARDGQRLSLQLLKEWDTNKRTNSTLAKRMESGSRLESTFKGVFAEKLQGTLQGLDTTFRSIDGWAIMKAIEAEGVTEAREQKENSMLEKMGL